MRDINSQDVDSGSILIPKISLSEKANPHKAVASPKKKKRFKKVWISVGLISLVLMMLITLAGYLTFNVYKKALAVNEAVTKIQVSIKENDIEKAKSEVANLKIKLADLRLSYKQIGFSKVLPYIGRYYSDGEHALNAANYGIEASDILVSAIEPYADIIGFGSKTDKAGSGGQTTQERLDFVVKTIPDLIPKADSLSEKASLIKKEVDQIDPADYPEKFQGKEVRSKIKQIVDLTDEAEVLIKNSKPLLKVAPYLMGVDGVRKYMVLFQNDKELRPTGGFLTAYTIAKVEKGRFEPVSSSDIYSLDSTYKPHIVAPAPLIKYLKGPYLISKNFRIRDLNWSPDFSVAMSTFSDESASVGIKNIDGIIAVDTQVLVNLLNVIGPVDVPGFGTYSTKEEPKCKCPQVIYELESFADIEGPVVWSQDEPGKIIFAPPNYDNRKKIIGPLMNSVLANTLGQPKEKLPGLFNALLASLMEKHILFYIYDDNAEKAISDFGIGGTISDYKNDYLLVNDANLGGRKSNLYVIQEINQDIEVAKDGAVTKTVTITYKNPEKQDGWLNSILPNWVRVYVPKGSSLISFDGVEDKEKPYEEFDKTVFAGYFALRPQGVSKLTLKYKLPMKMSKEYKILIQKQAGKESILNTIKIGKKSTEYVIKTDMELKFKI